MVSHCPRDELWILHVQFIWSIFLVPGTLLSDLPYSPNLTSHLLQQVAFVPQTGLHSPRDNSFLLLVTHLCCPSSSRLRSSPSSALCSPSRLGAPRGPYCLCQHSLPSSSVNSSWNCPGWHCIVYWIVEHLPCVPGLSPCLQRPGLCNIHSPDI